MDKESQFRADVRQYLDCLTSELSVVLAKLVSYDFPDEVAMLVFEVFSDEFTESFPVRAFFLDSDNTEFFVYTEGKAEYPSPVDPDLLEIDSVYPMEFEDTFMIGEAEFCLSAAATEELIDWFAQCWRDAGGTRFEKNAFMTHHDSARRFDLVKQMWVKY